MVLLRCFSCQKEISFPDAKLGFRAECSHCRSDLHSCRQCQFYDPKVYNECRETSAEVVKEKDRANYCEYFVVNDFQGSAATKADDPKARMREAAEALFKKKN